MPDVDAEALAFAFGEVGVDAAQRALVGHDLKEGVAAEARQRGGVDRIAHQRDRLFRDIAALRHARQAPARSLLSHLERCAQLDSSPVVGQKLR